MADIKCDTDEILTRLSVLDSLKQLRDNMGNDLFITTFPELNGMGGKLDTIINKQEAELQTKMEACGNIEVDELPQPMIEEPEEPEMPALPELEDEVSET